MTDFDMTRAEFERNEKRDQVLAEWYEYGPKCWTCKHGVNFSASAYPYALSKDATYCVEFMDLMEEPDEPKEELAECWEAC